MDLAWAAPCSLLLLHDTGPSRTVHEGGDAKDSWALSNTDSALSEKVARIRQLAKKRDGFDCADFVFGSRSCQNKTCFQLTSFWSFHFSGEFMQPLPRLDPKVLLTGAGSDQPLPRAISLPGAPNSKFSTNGEALVWPGNSFICHIPRPSPAFEALRYLQEQLKQGPFQRFFTFLPPHSFHMTVFQGFAPDLADAHLIPEDRGQSRDELTEQFKTRTAPLDLATSFEVSVHDLYALHSLTVSGATTHDETSLRETRTQLRQATGLTPPDFDSYVFHITLAYPITYVSQTTAQEMIDHSLELSASLPESLRKIPLGPVELCDFESMHHFHTVARLT
jgi:hypothetical protein